MKLTISFTDGREPVEVTPTTGDMVHLERTYGISAAQLDEHPKIEHIAYVAWRALKRTGGTDSDFETFIDEMDFGGMEDAPAHPLPPPVS